MSRGGERGCVSQTLQLALKGAVARAGVKVKASVTAAGGSFPLPPRGPPQGSSLLSSGARALPRQMRPPPAGTPLPHILPSPGLCSLPRTSLWFWDTSAGSAMPPAPREGACGAGERCSGKQSWASACEALSHGPRRVTVSQSFGSAASGRGAHLHPAHTNLETPRDI